MTTDMITARLTGHRNRLSHLKDIFVASCERAARACPNKAAWNRPAWHRYLHAAEAEERRLGPEIRHLQGEIAHLEALAAHPRSARNSPTSFAMERNSFMSQAFARTTTTAPIQRIRGTIGSKVLAKSPELFNQSLETILTETLQNARRAGATSVDIEIIGTTPNMTMTIRDNGHGITNLAVLVTFGASSWDEYTDVAENAAGMGMFSLASRGVTVRSRGHKVTLSREVFTGNADAAVLPDPDAPAGTELMFPITEEHAANLVRQAARFYPVPVRLNESQVPQECLTDKAVYTIEWQGLRIAVMRGDFSYLVPSASTLSHHRKMVINFFGHLVATSGPHAEEVDGKLWTAHLDVVSAPDLQLVLPTRNQVIENNFLRAARQRAHRAIYEAIALQEHHQLPFSNFESARQLGVDLGEPRIALQRWVVRRQHRHWPSFSTDYILGNHANEIVLADPQTMDPVEEANLETFRDKTNNTLTIAKAEPRFDGYQEYDALPRIAGINTEVRGSDGQSTIYNRTTASPDDCDKDSANSDAQDVVDSITAHLVVRQRRTNRLVQNVLLTHQIPFFFTCPTDTDFPGFVVTKSTNPTFLADALVLNFFHASDDAEADSHETQLEAYAADALDLARSLLLTAREAAIALIVENLRSATWALRRLGEGTVTITIRQGRPPEMLVQGSDGADTTTTL